MTSLGRVQEGASPVVCISLPSSSGLCLDCAGVLAVWYPSFLLIGEEANSKYLGEVRKELRPELRNFSHLAPSSLLLTSPLCCLLQSNAALEIGSLPSELPDLRREPWEGGWILPRTFLVCFHPVAVYPMRYPAGHGHSEPKFQPGTGVGMA